MNILFIDNFDSFTFNLVDEFEKRNCTVITFRNNIEFDKIKKAIKNNNFELIVISPGGFVPKQVPLCKEVILNYYKEIPIFGVCLGYQCIVEAFGDKIIRAPSPVHGKSSKIMHDNKSIFQFIPNPTLGGRYHSQMGASIPDCFEITAKTDDGIEMAVRHKKYPVEGVLFHPESILTPLGGVLIQNLINKVLKR